MIEFVGEARIAPPHSRPLTGEDGWITVGLFGSWFKSDYSVSRKGKPKIGLKHRNKVDEAFQG